MKLFITLVLLISLAAGCVSDQGEAQETPTPPPHTKTPQIGVTLVTRAPPTMNVVQTTPTPLPTATPTPSATPIRYTVEEGDTLLGIAIENLTTVEEIETRNPGVIPELLQIGQVLILPPPATPVFSGQSATPVPLQTEIRAVQNIRTPVGSMWLLGELVNNGAFPVAGLQVQIDLVGPDNAVLGSALAWVAPGVLPPGGHGPFATLLREPPTQEVQPSVSVVAGDTLMEQGSYYLDLAVADSEVNIEDGLVNVAGSVENIGEDVATSISVVATFYGARGEVTGYAQQHLQGPLSPGEEAKFDVGGSPPGGQTVDVTIGAVGLKELSSSR